MDAYNIYQSLKHYWAQLVTPHSGNSPKQNWQTIPVYVQVNGTLYQVTNCQLNDDKIVLTT